MAPNSTLGAMSFSIPQDLVAYLHAIDDFIITRIAPLQASNDNERFFDHRREHARVGPKSTCVHPPPDLFHRPTGIIRAFHVTIGKSS